jgi:nicotinate phosphoribosyltransferase
MPLATTLQSGDALVIVDVQNDFLPAGALAVPRAGEILCVLREYAARFERRHLPVLVVRDWHPADHASFRRRGGAWAEHCVQFSPGAETPHGLELPPGAITISKGTEAADESGSAFANPRFEPTLRTLRVHRLFVGGLGTEHGVFATVRDARRLGFEVFLLRDAVRAMNLRPEDGARAEGEMVRLGAVPLTAFELCQRDPAGSALLTDIFEVGMLRAYHDAGMTDTAVFEFAVRRLPPGRNFLVAAGLEQVLQFLEELHFNDWEIDWLERTHQFSPEFLAGLKGLRFSGDVDAMPEGTLFFPHEPVVRITAPIAEAQLVETRLTNLVHYPTLVASKAVRAVLAAAGRPLVDVGLRRAHGAEAAVLAARACYLAGFSATSDALAAQHYGIPAAGTMARSFVEAAITEEDAFRRYARSDPAHVVLLIDTYDAVAAARTVVRLAPELQAEGIEIRGVRLESGELEPQARRVREILDAGGLRAVQILASGNLDECAVAKLVAAGAPIDGFALGTRLVTSADGPYLDCDYKLQRYDGRARTRRAEGETTWPGIKQVFRERGPAGTWECDVVALDGETHEGEPLLVPVMRAGRRLGCGDTLAAARERVARGVELLPPRLRSLAPAAPFPVYMSERLHNECVTAGIFPEPATPDVAPGGPPAPEPRPTVAAPVGACLAG